MNRKLIRPKLTEVNIGQQSKAAPANTAPRSLKSNQNGQQPKTQNSGKGGGQQAQKKSPPQDTNAEIFYYKKQIDGHVPMIVILQDGEKISGTIEWYDRHALKINREDGPNILLLKHNIKYMYKDPERS